MPANTQPLNWPTDAPLGSIAPMCLDTCHKARDGVCDEGRPKRGAGPIDRHAAPLTVLCDLGTDCQDCGPWAPTTTAVSWRLDGLGGPISRLQARHVEVRVRRTALKPLDFMFAYTDPAKDVDVSAHMQGSGWIELENSMVFHKILKGGCRPSDASRGLFLDVGANFGWFSVMAASLGCRVASFEPVPHFHAFLEYNLHVNGLAHLADLRQLIVSSQSGVSLNMTVPSTGVWGTAGIGGLNIDHNIQGSHEQITVPSVRLEDLVKEPVLLMKMDVEGWEFSVYDGAQSVIQQHGIDNIVLEYSPGVPERSFKIPELEQTTLMLTKLVAARYSILHIRDGGPHQRLDFPNDITQALPPMKEVTAHNLQYELADITLFKNRRLGCALGQSPTQTQHGRHKELRDANPEAWELCNGSPEDLSPRSLRSVMGHNTNLWASRKRDSMPLAGPVGLLPLTAPNTQYFPDDGAVWGLGHRMCKDVPPKVQVRHRCRCTDPSVCGREEAEILRLSQQGDRAIASNYVLPPPNA